MYFVYSVIHVAWKSKESVDLAYEQSYICMG